MVCEPKLYGIDSQNSNSMKSGNPHSGCHEMDTSRTLDTGACSGNGGQVVVFDGKQVTSKQNRSNLQPGAPCHTLASGSADSAVICVEGNGARPSHKGSGISEDGVAYTLNATEQHGVSYAMTTGCYTQVCEEKTPTLQARDYKDAPIVGSPVYGIDRAAFNQGKNAQFSPSVNEEQSPTIVAKGPGAVALPTQARYIVRRLTPTECALLQGFPPTWCVGLETAEPTEADIAFWSEVFETYRRIMGTSDKTKSRNQIVKWLRHPHTDSAEYKMWGNGVALPCVRFVLEGIVWAAGGSPS
jgi:DNA (cytosine-5)-methyltransferase 1